MFYKSFVVTVQQPYNCTFLESVKFCTKLVKVSTNLTKYGANFINYLITNLY